MWLIRIKCSKRIQSDDLKGALTMKYFNNASVQNLRQRKTQKKLKQKRNEIADFLLILHVWLERYHWKLPQFIKEWKALSCILYANFQRDSVLQSASFQQLHLNTHRFSKFSKATHFKTFPHMAIFIVTQMCTTYLTSSSSYFISIWKPCSQATYM